MVNQTPETLTNLNAKFAHILRTEVPTLVQLGLIDWQADNYLNRLEQGQSALQLVDEARAAALGVLSALFESVHNKNPTALLHLSSTDQEKVAYIPNLIKAKNADLAKIIELHRIYRELQAQTTVEPQNGSAILVNLGNNIITEATRLVTLGTLNELSRQNLGNQVDQIITQFNNNSLTYQQALAALRALADLK